jgi:serine/threonine protein phosphatase PrpC
MALDLFALDRMKNLIVSFGDTDYKKLLISEPEISKYDLTREDKFIILGSDSVWDVMTIEEACEFFYSMD